MHERKSSANTLLKLDGTLVFALPYLPFIDKRQVLFPLESCSYHCELF